MKTKSIFILTAILSSLLLGLPKAQAMGGDPQASQMPTPVTNAQSAMDEAMQDLRQAASEFNGSQPSSNQQSGQTSWSQATGSQNNPAQTTGPAEDPRNQALQGSAATGYAGTWTDPATGDIMTSVIAPAPQPSQNQNYPMIIEPQVSGGNYYNAGSQNYYPQWPTSPENPGYPPNANVPYNQPPPPGWHAPYPGQPYPGFNPYPYSGPLGWQPYPGYGPSQNAGPVPGSTPPPFPPGYRPLRPNPPQAMQPAIPPASNPGSIWQPGMSPASPGVQPLPMNPAGQSWNNSPFAPQAPRGGMFNRPGGF